MWVLIHTQPKSSAFETRMAVQVSVNDRGPYRFVVDSGADRSAISSDVARSLRLPRGGQVTLHSMDGSAVVSTVRIGRLRFGSNEVRDVEAPELSARDLGADGLLGIDALAEQRLMLDFERATITVEDATRPSRMAGGEVVVTARRRRGQLIITSARTAGAPVDAVIDTGSQVTVGNAALRARLFRHRAPRVVRVELIGVTGRSAPADLVVVPELSLGPLSIRDLPVAFVDVPPFELFDLTDRPALLLGTDALGTFRRVSLDFRARKVRFEPRRCGATNPTTAMVYVARLGGCGQQ